MDHDQLKDLLPLEALGSLEGEESRAMAAHLAEGCDDCQAELRSFGEALAAMAISAAGDGPSDRIWQRLESRLAVSAGAAASPGAGAAKDRPAGSAHDRADRAARIGVSRTWRAAAVAASAAAIVLAVLTANYAS